MIKKIFKPIILIFIVFLVVSCDSEPAGIEPTKPFELDSYFQSNMVLSQNQEINITGKSEKGVQITLSLFDQKGNKVKKVSTIVNDKNEFVLSFNSPKASNNLYKIVIDDSVNEKTLDNIFFGYVFLFLGEKYDEIDINSSIKEDEKIFACQLSNEAFEWDLLSNTDLNDSIKTSMSGIYEELQLPIAIIDATVSNAYLDIYLSNESIENYKNIHRYLELQNRLNMDESNYSPSSMYQKYIERLSNITIDSIVWYQGKYEITSFDNYESLQFSTLYSYCLNHLFTNLNNIFKCSFYTIQSGYCEGLDLNQIRLLQANPSQNMSNVHLIPTYDCYGLDGLDQTKLVSRIVEMIYQNQFKKQKVRALSLSDVVSYDHQIELSFYGSGLLEKVEDIYGLSVTDQLGNELSYKLLFEDNVLQIIVNDSNFEEEILQVIITYGYNEDLFNNNLFSSKQLPVVPFRVSVEL